MSRVQIEQNREACKRMARRGRKRGTRARERESRKREREKKEREGERKKEKEKERAMNFRPWARAAQAL